MIFTVVLITLSICIYINITLKVRRYGSSMTSIMFASTYEFLNNDNARLRKKLQRWMQTIIC